MKRDEEKRLIANIPPFGLRMQPELKQKVEMAAKANNRSMNAEIVATLEASYLPKSPIELTPEDLQSQKTESLRYRAVLNFERALDEFIASVGGNEASPPIESGRIDDVAGAAAVAHLIELQNLIADLRTGSAEQSLQRATAGYGSAVEALVDILEEAAGSGPSSRQLRSQVELARRMLESLSRRRPAEQRKLEADVRLIIELIHSEAAGKQPPAHVEMQSQLGEELGDALTVRTKFAVETLHNLLKDAGLLASPDQAESAKNEVESRFSKAG